MSVVLRLHAARTLDLVCNFLWLAVVARTMPAEQVGIYAVAAGVSAFVVITLSFGGDEMIMSSVRSGLSDDTAAELRRRLAVGIVVVAAGAVAGGIAPAVFWTVLWCALLALTNLGQAFHTRRSRPDGQLIGSVLFLGVLGAQAVLLPPATAVAALAGITVAQAVKTVCTLPYGAFGRIRHGAHWSELAHRPPGGGRRRAVLTFSALSGPILGRQLDVTVAGLLAVSLAQVGTYGAAYSTAYLASTVLLLGLGAMTLSSLADVAERGRGEVLTRWRALLAYTSAVSFPPLVIGSAVAPEVMRVLYGPLADDGSAAAFMIAVCAALCLQRAMGAGTNYALLTVLHTNRAIARSVLVSLVTRLLPALALMPLLGMWAAVLGAFVSYAATSGYVLWVIKAQTGAGIDVADQLLLFVVSLAGGALTWGAVSLLGIGDLIALVVACLVGAATVAVSLWVCRIRTREGVAGEHPAVA